MRKRVLVLLGILLSLSAAACGGNSNVTKDVDNPVESESTELSLAADAEAAEDLDGAEMSSEETESAEPEEVIYNIGETAVLKDWEISVTDMQIVDSISSDYVVFSPNEEGNKFAQAFVTVNNKGKQSDSFLPSFGYGDDVYAKLVYGDGYEFTATQLLGYDGDLHDSTINPLSSQSGEIAFEIPEAVVNATDEILIRFYSGDDMAIFKVR